MNARFDGHCRLQKMTGCNGIKKGEPILNQAENYNSHMSCNDKVDEKLRDGSLQPCSHSYEWSNYCGSKVCLSCSDHKGLARCYCGWSANGGDGYGQLIAMGETIEPDY